MSGTDKSVFISYRRKLGAGWARAIFADLRARGYDVFMDVESIDSGTFETVILNQIEARAHFLLILTPGTLDRCREPNDWLTREIDHAIKLQRNIVPLTFEKFSFSEQAKSLPSLLAGLPKYNSLGIYHDYFDDGMTKLRERFLKQPTIGAIKPAPQADHGKFLDLLNATQRQMPSFDPKSTGLNWAGSIAKNVKDSPSATEKPADPFGWPKWLQKDASLESILPNLKPPKTQFAETLAKYSATGDHIKWGDFALNAAAISTTVLNKLEEFLATGETIKQVVFGKNGSFIILRNWCGFWQQGIPEDMAKQLWELLNENQGIPYVALGPENRWIILRDQPHLMWKDGITPPNLFAKLLEVWRDGKEIKCVAYSESGGWVMLFGKNGFWSENIGTDLLEKLHEWRELHYDLKQVAFGPNSSWVLLAGDNGYWQSQVPKKMADKLKEYHQAGKTINSVALAPDSGWVILGDG
jgi:TIR domain